MKSTSDVKEVSKEKVVAKAADCPCDFFAGVGMLAIGLAVCAVLLGFVAWVISIENAKQDIVSIKQSLISQEKSLRRRWIIGEIAEKQICLLKFGGSVPEEKQTVEVKKLVDKCYYSFDTDAELNEGSLLQYQSNNLRFPYQIGP